MVDFAEYLALNEKKGRTSKDPFHSKNVDFINQYYGREIPKANRTNCINSLRRKFLRTIEQHDKELLKKLQDDSLDSLQKLIDDYGIQMAKPLRKQDWRQAEKDIVDGINELFKRQVFVYIGKDGKERAIGSDRFAAKQVGGSRDSDISIANIEKNLTVFVESKLDFQTAEYFKFRVLVQNGKLKYDHSFHLRNLDQEEKDKMDLFFSRDLDLSGFLNEIVQKPEVKAYWDQFLSNLDEVGKVIANDDEFKDFAGKVDLSKKFPDNASQLVTVFDTYVKHYVKKYEDLTWQMYSTLEENGLDAPDEYTDFADGKRDVKQTFEKANYFIDMIYTWQEMKDADEGIQLKLDEKKLMALADELKTIEAKLSRIMDTVGTQNPSDLMSLPTVDKLRYFFAAFLSSTGRKRKGKHELVALQQDELGNMVVCPWIDVENSRLAKAICDYYVKKDRCIYMQIGHVVYTLAKDYNLFALPSPPCFEDCMTKFQIGLVVSDDMSRVGLHVKAYEPDSKVLEKHTLLSFKQKDANFIGKKLKRVEIR